MHNFAMCGSEGHGEGGGRLGANGMGGTRLGLLHAWAGEARRGSRAAMSGGAALTLACSMRWLGRRVGLGRREETERRDWNEGARV
jgi:hypothetical protein